VLFGGAARDLLIGGTAQDVLFGNRGGDIMIAGSTRFDSIQIALAAIMREWTSNHTYDQRVKNLTGVSHSKFAKRLNGNVFLVSATVQNDDIANVAAGGKGKDVYFINDTGPNADFVIDQTRHKRRA
jgi:Ca2+-binding RTX toxin-like protein